MIEIHIEGIRTGKDLEARRVEFPIAVLVLGIQNTVYNKCIFAVIQNPVAVGVLGINGFIDDYVVFSREIRGPINRRQQGPPGCPDIHLHGQIHDLGRDIVHTDEADVVGTALDREETRPQQIGCQPQLGHALQQTEDSAVRLHHGNAEVEIRSHQADGVLVEFRGLVGIDEVVPVNVSVLHTVHPDGVAAFNRNVVYCFLNHRKGLIDHLVLHRGL